MFRSKVLRPIAGLVLVTFTALTLQPLTAAAQLPSAPKRQETRSASGEERFSRTLVEIHEILKEVVPQAAMPHRQRSAGPEIPGKPGDKVLQAVGPKLRLESEVAKPRAGVDVAAKVKALRAKFKELKSLEGEVTKSFKETERHIRDKNLPAEILARHEQAVAEYEKRKGEFGALMQRVEAADDGKGDLPSALAGLGEFMAKYPNDKTHTPTDPNNLPWGSPKPVTRAPYTSPSQFKTSRLFGEPVKVAQAGSLSGIGLPSTVLPTTPMPADTAATEDVQITQAIRDLATSLGNKPVPIYNWVRNNIQFIPSYGSIQGSDMTLQTKRGNAFDTASLLIALLRAANIPARYVYGTIEVPADKAMNWVGGVTVPQAAMNLMGQGGIPTIGLASGGQVRAIRLEHVWVEAYVDYVPSRGAVNRSPNTWVPMDASFKQYQYQAGVDIKSAVPLDAQAVVTQLQQGATINQSEMWMQNANQAAVQQAIRSYQTQVTDYFGAQKPNATVADVLGSKAIIQDERQILLGTLPYTRVATGAKFQSVPDNLRAKFQYNLYGSDFDRAMDSPVAQFVQSLPKLSGKKITLSFAPATQADANLIESYLPAPHPDGTPIELSEFPKILPGYLIRLTPEFRVDGQVVASGGTFTMGTEMVSTMGLFDPSEGWNFGEDNHPITGEYIATHVDYQGLSPAQTQATSAKLASSKALLDAHQLTGITKEELTGDVLYSVVLAYFVANQAAGEIAARAAGIVEYRKPSFGNFQTSAQPQFWFGIPRNVGFPGLTMDVDRYVSMSVAKDNSAAANVAYQQQSGMRLSAYEHSIPEQVFTNLQDPNRPQGVSAAKALAIAAAQGQRIYTVNGQNVDLVLPQLSISADVKDEIFNSVMAGRVAVVSQAPIAVSGWSGVGYIINDPATGAGAYKIGGGFSGAHLLWNEIGAAFSAMLDALLKHYRDPNSMFGPDAERAFARFGKAMSDALGVVILVKDILETLANDKLNTAQKVVKIIGAAIIAISGVLIAGAVGALFFNPVGAVIVAMLLVVLVSLLVEFLVDWIVGALAFYWKFRDRWLIAAYA